MKVLLPIDGSVYSDRAIEYICEHSSLRAKTDTVYLLNVQKKLPSGFASKIPNSEEILDEAAKKILKPAKKALEAAGYKVKMKVAYGKATNRIVEYAQEIPALIEKLHKLGGSSWVREQIIKSKDRKISKKNLLKNKEKFNLSAKLLVLFLEDMEISRLK
jgi:hypothetical protein